MARVDEFDAFYHATRRPLLHQTYALTGEVDRAALSVEHAFANAWSHWRKVRRLPDPVAWVRGEAWRMAGGVLARRRWRRVTGRRRALEAAPRPSGPHADDLQALRDLPDGQRRAVILHHLAELSTERIARELAVTEAAASGLLARGEREWDDSATTIGGALARLEDDIAGVRLIRAPRLRRSGERHHRRQTMVGVVTAAALLVCGGVLTTTDRPAVLREAAVGDSVGEASPPPAGDPATSREGSTRPGPDRSVADESSPGSAAPIPESFLLDRSALLTASQLRPVSRPAHDWTTDSTTDGTTGDPIYAPCQQEPFADPDGNQALLRRFSADTPGVSGVQVIEESRSEAEAAKAFATMQGWYARCQDDGVQLVNTWNVGGLGDEARAFLLRRIGRDDTYLTVGMVRTGPITIAVLASTRGDEPISARRALDRAAVSVTRVCLPVSGDCSTRTAVRTARPLPTEQSPGFVAAFDLPKVSGVTAPWVGTDPDPSPRNPATTPCDRARFAAAQHPRSRVFVLPTARQVPPRFGLTETVGTFASRAKAGAFVQRVYTSARTCPDRELSASKPRSRGLPGGHPGRVWRFEFEVDKQTRVFYRVGIVRAGPRVALVSMSPTRAHDVPAPQFSRLLARAGDRLREAAERADEDGGQGPG